MSGSAVNFNFPDSARAIVYFKDVDVVGFLESALDLKLFFILADLDFVRVCRFGSLYSRRSHFYNKRAKMFMI